MPAQHKPRLTPVSEMICSCGRHRREHPNDGLIRRGGHFCPGYEGPRTWPTNAPNLPEGLEHCDEDECFNIVPGGGTCDDC